MKPNPEIILTKCIKITLLERYTEFFKTTFIYNHKIGGKKIKGKWLTQFIKINKNNINSLSFNNTSKIYITLHSP